MEGTSDRYSPRFFVTAIAAPAGLLSDEEAHVVVFVVCGMETLGAQNAAVVQSTVPV